MNPKRVGVLLSKEFLQGPKNFIFVYAIVAPILISLVVSLVFGNLFSEKPKLGIMDEGSSQMVTRARGLDSVVIREYGTLAEITQATRSGAVDVGVVLPEDFDDSVTQGNLTEITAYIWGESLAKNRTILAATITDLARDLTGEEAPIEIESITLGDEVSIPWNDRLLPLIVLVAVVFGGTVSAATSVINEKEKKTLEALVVTSTSVGDIFVAKGLLGIILSLVMGVVILILNQAFGAEPTLLLLVLGLGSVMAAEFGLLFGVLMKDITAFFATIKLIGVLFYAPAIVYLFPEIPEWVARVFPTYYLIQPIVEISQRGGTWPDIATNVFILIGLDLLLVGVVMLTLRRTRQYAI
ncbi:MAG: ABC transporter permease [Chloroflexota bacterium]